MKGIPYSDKKVTTPYLLKNNLVDVPLLRDVVAGPRVEIADQHLLIPFKIAFDHGQLVV
jgi:hypothetical protein